MIKQPPHGSSATPPAAPGRPDDVPEGEARERHVPEKRDDARRGDEVRERIGHELRKMFEVVVAEPVPEKFRRLIDDLAAKSGKA
jgi:hypothetical protein